MKDILVVDDSRLARHTLRRTLESAGYSVREAKNADEALDQYARQRPDLVLLDLTMPGLDGRQVMRILRDMDPDAKVIIASADSQLATQVEVRMAGAADYLLKPFQPEQVLEKVSRALNQTANLALSQVQRHLLAELINSGCQQAARALAGLTGRRVLLEAPKIGAFPLEEIGPALAALFPGQVGSVHLGFSGPVSGVALLVVGEQAAPLLRSLFQEDDPAQEIWDPPAREALAEVGNVLLNACVGLLSNRAHLQVTFALPHLQVDSPSGILRVLPIAQQSLQCALVAQTRFQLRGTNVTGYLLIILGLAPYTRLLQSLADFQHFEHPHPAPPSP